MFLKISTLAFSLCVGSSLFATPCAHAATPQADNTEQIMTVYSKFKTFGDLAKWLQAYELATNDELHGIEAVLQKNGLSLKSEMIKGVFTSKRLNWDDVHMQKILAGDWKTIGGRILVAHSGTPVDQLFAQAMTMLDPKSAQRTPLDLLIDTADASTSANARASAAGGWTWLSRLRWASSTVIASIFNNGQGKADCDSNDAFIIQSGYEGTDASARTIKLPNHPFPPELLSLMRAREPNLFKKCTLSNVETARRVYEAPGRTPSDKLKNSGQFPESSASSGHNSARDNYDDNIRAGRAAR